MKDYEIFSILWLIWFILFVLTQLHIPFITPFFSSLPVLQFGILLLISTIIAVIIKKL